MECTDPGGCTLDSTEMIERVAAWRDISSRAISREVLSGRIISTYPSERAVIATLEELIAAEVLCCSFMTFELRQHEDQTVVELTFPEEARPLVESVISVPVEVP